MVNKFTPGPWELERKFMRVVTPSKNGLRKVIALVGRQRNYEEQEANARLIAAAPEMYDELKSMVSRLKAFFNYDIRRVTVYDLQVFCNESSVLLDSAEKLLARIDGEATNE